MMGLVLRGFRGGRRRVLRRLGLVDDGGLVGGCRSGCLGSTWVEEEEEEEENRGQGTYKFMFCFSDI